MVSKVGHAHLKPARVRKCEQHTLYRAWCRSTGEPGIYKRSKYHALLAKIWAIREIDRAWIWNYTGPESRPLTLGEIAELLAEVRAMGRIRAGGYKAPKYRAGKHTTGIDQDEGYAFEVDISAGDGKCGKADKMSDRMAALATEDTTPEVRQDPGEVMTELGEEYQEAVMTELDIRLLKRFRITSGDRLDSYIVPDRNLRTTKAEAKCGYDTDLERETREWLARYNWVPEGLGTQLTGETMARNLVRDVLYVHPEGFMLAA